MGGPMEKRWCHVPIPLTQKPVPHMDDCPAYCVDQGRVPEDGYPNSHKKDMCQLESSGNRIDQSPWVQ